MADWRNELELRNSNEVLRRRVAELEALDLEDEKERTIVYLRAALRAVLDDRPNAAAFVKWDDLDENLRAVPSEETPQPDHADIAKCLAERWDIDPDDAEAIVLDVLRAAGESV